VPPAAAPGSSAWLFQGPSLARAGMRMPADFWAPVRASVREPGLWPRAGRPADTLPMPARPKGFSHAAVPGVQLTRESLGKAHRAGFARRATSAAAEAGWVRGLRCGAARAGRAGACCRETHGYTRAAAKLVAA